MIVSKITDIPANTSVAVLCAETEKAPFFLKPEESEQIRKKFEKGNTCLLQRLPHFIFWAKPAEEKRPETALEKMRRAGADWMETVKQEKIDRLVVAGFTGSAHTLAFLEGFLLGGYTFPKYRKEKDDFLPAEVWVLDSQVTTGMLDELTVVTEAVCWARDLVNEPLSHLTALQLAEEFSRQGETAGFGVEIFHKQKIQSLKMGGLLAVNRGSIDPPTFTVMEWKPANAPAMQPVVLVGKGIVYDTGGLSLKPTPKSMDYMKSDMAGAAVVGAVIGAAARMKLPLHLVGLVPATDNRPDGNALTPGDVITMYDGTTVEVLNTDAEGRLILADALSYAKKFNPRLVIDVATLTGSAAMISSSHGLVAMGNSPHYLGLMQQSGWEVYERVVELPLWEEFANPLKSDIADLTNLGSREGQTTIAGKFLEHFTAYDWIHLDIAGNAFLFEKDGYRPKGGSGSGIRLLLNFLNRMK